MVNCYDMLGQSLEVGDHLISERGSRLGLFVITSIHPSNSTEYRCVMVQDTDGLSYLLYAPANYNRVYSLYLADDFIKVNHIYDRAGNAK